MPSTDANGLELLDRAECLGLLGARNFGRVGLSVDAMPTVLPVTYRLVRETVYFRTGAGRKLSAATARNVIAFEVDDLDALSQSGWSVVVTGVAEEVTDPDELDAVMQIGIPRWAPSGASRIVRLGTEIISGRRLNCLGSPLVPAR